MGISFTKIIFALTMLNNYLEFNETRILNSAYCPLVRPETSTPILYKNQLCFMINLLFI